MYLSYSVHKDGYTLFCNIPSSCYSLLLEAAPTLMRGAGSGRLEGPCTTLMLECVNMAHPYMMNGYQLSDQSCYQLLVDLLMVNPSAMVVVLLYSVTNHAGSAIM